MGLKPGYKQTEVGAIPDDWKDVPITQVTHEIFLGLTAKVDYVEHGGVPLVRATDIASGRLTFANARTISTKQHKMLTKYRKVQRGDILVSKSGSLGVCAIVDVDREFSIYESIIVLQPKDELDSKFLLHLLRDEQTQSRMIGDRVGSSVAHLNLENFRNLNIPLPPNKAEQEVIAETLSDADALIESLEQFIAKKRNIKQGATEELLTGKKRLPGFNDEWKEKRIAEIAFPNSEKNTEAARLPVLTCSKHLGFVDSLSYFKNQVFSNDTSTYKLIRRGQIGYPANHVEEGSIGLQDLYDVALVSPIYVVFSVSEEVSSYFLHRVLKLDSYRHKFKVATTASVDRRGSLRWPAFSEITVNLPSLPEQTAIIAVLADMDAEIAALDAKLDKARWLKQGMMHNLLTGSIRLV